MNDVKLVPSDVWLEILRRIPAADLVPLKAVCKTFRRLISSNFFARLHLDDFTKAKRTMIITAPSAKTFHYDPDRRTISVWNDEPRFGDWCSHVFPHRHHHRHWVIDSYRGLLLVQICARLLLCNPITKSYKFLRPSFSQVYFGCWKIAYDDVSKQYKVFGLNWTQNEFSLYVFDVHREGELPPPRKIKAILKFEEDFHEHLPCVLVNGSLYWLITPRLVNDKTYIIVSVNATTEEVKTRSFSFTPLTVTYYNHFFVSNGTFYLEQIYYPDFNRHLWVLEGLESENPNPSWMIKHRIENPHLFSILGHIHWRAIGVFRNKMLIMTMLSHELYKYDLGNEEFEKVKVARDDNNELGMLTFVKFCIVEHIDSLLSLGPINEEVWV